MKHNTNQESLRNAFCSRASDCYHFATRITSFRNKLMTRSGSSTDEGLCLSSSSDSEQSLSKDDDGSEDDVGFENFKNLELLREKTRIKTIFETYKSDLIIEYLINILTNSQETKILTAFRLLFPEATRAAQQEMVLMYYTMKNITLWGLLGTFFDK